MPGMWTDIDTGFPKIDGHESTEKKLVTIQDYLYMLVETLGYTLRNLDMSRNINQTSLEIYTNNITNSISDPIYRRIEDAEGNLTQLSIDSTGLALRISNAEGDITQLGINATGLALRVSNAEGDITQLGINATGLALRVSNAEGDITQLGINATGLALRVSNAEGDITQLGIDATGLALRVSNAEGDITQLGIDATGLALRVSNAEGNITSLSITASGLQTRVSSAEGNISTLTQTVNGFQLSASSGPSGTTSTLTLTSGGIYFASTTISFSGLVKFTDLSSSGMTTIDGGNITSGVITGATLRSISGSTQVWIRNGAMQIYNGAGMLVGGVEYNTNGAGSSTEARNRVYVYTQYGTALKIETFGANMSIEANGGYVYAMGNWSFWGADVVGLERSYSAL